MPTVHFRQGTKTIVLSEQPTTAVPALIAELAEVSVSSQLATQDDVAESRSAISNGNSWEEISESNETLESLNVTDASIVGYTFGDGDFAYEAYPTPS